MEKTSRAKQKLLASIKKRNPSLSHKDLSDIVDGLRRFVLLTQRLYTEPQAQIRYKDMKIGGKTEPHRIITTDIVEFSKIANKKGPMRLTTELFKKFNEKVTKDKYGR